MPDNPSAGGAAAVADIPTALAVAAGALFVAHVDLADDGRSATVAMKRLPLAPGTVAVEVTDGLSGGTQSQPALLRRWKFSWGDGQRVEFEGVVRRYDGWHEGPDSAEFVAEAVANAIGWTLPADGGA